MAIRKQRLMRQLDDGTLDTIWLETSADIVIIKNPDGTNSTVTQEFETTHEKIVETETRITETKAELVESITNVTTIVEKIQEVVKPPEIPDVPIEPPPTDPDKEPGGDNIDDPPTNDGTLDGYKPGEIITMVPSVGDGITGSCTGYFYFVFERPDFRAVSTNKYELRLSQQLHKMAPTYTSPHYMLRARVGRTAVDYFRDTTLGAIRDKLIECQRTALGRYSGGEHSEFPMDDDGNVILTWEQVQVWMLEDVLKTRSQARDYCLSKNIKWKNIDTLGVTTTVTIEDIMSACYIPAATPGASTAIIDRILSYDVIQALHLRQRDVGVAIQNKYDLFGKMVSNTWSTNDASVYWDLRTKELVVESAGAFPGDIAIIG